MQLNKTIPTDLKYMLRFRVFTRGETEGEGEAGKEKEEGEKGEERQRGRKERGRRARREGQRRKGQVKLIYCLQRKIFTRSNQSPETHPTSSIYGLWAGDSTILSLCPAMRR